MNLKSFSKICAVFSSQSLICHCFFSKVLIDDTDSKNRVQIVKFSMELDQKIFNEQ